MKSINRVMKFLNRIDSNNSGGCGISALTMYLWLEKHEQFMAKILFCYEEDAESRYTHNECILNNGKNENLLVPNHIVLVYKNNKIDSGGKLKFFKKIYKYNHEVDFNTLIDTINGKGWSDTFNRSNGKKIEKEIGFKLPIKKKLTTYMY